VALDVSHLAEPTTITAPELPTVTPIAAPELPAVTPIAASELPAEMDLPAIVALVWLTGAAIHAGILVVMRLGWSWRLRRSRVSAASDATALLHDLSRRLGLRRKVRLLVTSQPVGPAVFGLLRPTLVLPATILAEKTTSKLEAVLAHELIHVRRGDIIAGLLQLLAQTLWWFHPLVWWANREQSRQRERCCDEEVLANLNCEPAEYAQSLIDLLKLKRSLRPITAFPGIRPVEVTSKRLESIMDSTRQFRRRTPRWHWLALAIGILAFVPGAGLTLGDSTPSSEEHAVVKPAAEVDSADALRDLATTKKTNEEKVEKPSPYRKTSPGGGSVEIIGVCENPGKDARWWRPDGSPLADTPYITISSSSVQPDAIVRHFAIRLRDVGFEKLKWEVDPQHGSMYIQNTNPQKTLHTRLITLRKDDDLVGITVCLRADAKSAMIRVSCLDGKWQTRFSTDGSGGSATGGLLGACIFSKTQQTPSGVELNVTHEIHDQASRVVAIGTDGKEFLSKLIQNMTANNMLQSIAIFPRHLATKDIKEFQLQTQPYKWIIFENVAIRPVDASSKPVIQTVADTKTALSKSTPPSESSLVKPVAPDAIIEGVGWNDVRVGMKREDLIEAMGKPDNDPSSNVLRWADKHIDCSFHTGSLVVSEVRFNKGFNAALKNGIKLGSSGDTMLKQYGEPDHVIARRNGAKQYEYSTKGILLWTYQGKITQIVVFKPYAISRSASKKSSGVYRPFPGDAKLNEAQRLYSQWDAKQFGLPDPAKWKNLSVRKKTATEDKFLKQLTSDKESERVEAIDALVSLGSKKAVAPILQIAADRKEKNNWDRHTACRALGMLGDSSVVPELAHLTYHFNWNTRQWAQISLVRLTGQNFGRNVAAWKQWQEKQGGKPPISDKTVVWATSPWLLSMLKGAQDPKKQDEMDRRSVKMMKRSLGQDRPARKATLGRP